MSSPQKILDFWFEGVTDAVPINKNAMPFKKWFAKNAAFDESIRRNFEGDLRKAWKGEYSAWEESIRPRLALILLFDQFPRNMYRDNHRAFASDPLALDLTLRSLKDESDGQLQMIERVFLYMPLMHSEEAQIQRLGVKCFQGLVEQAKKENPRNAHYFEYNLSYAKQHLVIIEKFGRFPHRNAILNRETTIDERKFLNKPGSSF